MPAHREPVTHSINEDSAAREAAAPGLHSRATLDGLVPILYDELRKAARHQLAVRAGGTLSTTDLVHESLERHIMTMSGWQIGRLDTEYIGQEGTLRNCDGS